MNPKLVAKAESRLRAAKKALDELRVAQNAQDFSDTWYTFLVAAKNVYTCLEQGAKDTPQCRQWFGGVKAQRKRDELLQYLFQARDDEEHGVEVATELRKGSLRIGVNKPGYSSSMHIRSLEIDGDGNISMDATSHDGKPILVEITPDHMVLRPVTDRGGNIYNPPTSHLGQPLLHNLPFTVAELGFAYLAALVEEAGKRA